MSLLDAHAADNDPPTHVDIHGTQRWYNAAGQKHRGNDKPALIRANGEQQWYVNGRLHRENDQPAIIRADGRMEWRVNGQRHRENDQPANTHPNGKMKWCRNGLLHRENEQPAVVWSDGHCQWWVNGEQHSIPFNRPWSHTDHAKWHDHYYHPTANRLIATFLLAYNRLVDAGQWPIHAFVIEDIFTCGTWRDYTHA